MNKKFKLNKAYESPENIDFDKLKFYKNYIVVKGELKYVEYYREYDNINNIYSDLVVKIFNTYNRDVIGVILNRESVIEFYLEDGTVGVTKPWTKYYPADQAINEGIQRRKNLISQAKVVLLRELKSLYGEPLNQQYGFDLLLSVKTQMGYFEDGYTQPLRDAINNSAKTYLNANIKTLIVEELTY